MNYNKDFVWYSDPNKEIKFGLDSKLGIHFVFKPNSDSNDYGFGFVFKFKKSIIMDLDFNSNVKNLDSHTSDYFDQEYS